METWSGCYSELCPQEELSRDEAVADQDQKVPDHAHRCGCHGTGIIPEVIWNRYKKKHLLTLLTLKYVV